MKIEKTIIENLEEINKIGVQCHNLHVEWRDDIFRKTNIFMTEERLNNLISEEKIFTVSLENEVVGFMILDEKIRVNIEVLQEKKYLVVDTLAIDEKYRRKGIGTKLLEFAEDLAIKKGYTDLSLTVNKENEAGINSYEKFGFKVKNITYTKKVGKIGE